MRTVLLVDISNLYHALRESHGRLRYDRLLEWVRRDGELIAAVAFSAYHPERPEQMAFLNALSIAGFRVHARPVRRAESPDGSEIPPGAGNIDVALTMEAVQLAPRADRFLLASGDGDFADLVHFLAQNGKIVWVIASRAALSAELARAAHRVVLLEGLEEEIPGLIERTGEGSATERPPEEPSPPGPIEALLRQTVRAMAELARESPGGFSISLIGSRNPALAGQARSAGRLPALAALALLDGALPGWTIVPEGSELMARPGRAGAATVRMLQELVLAGWSGIPPLPAVRPVLEALAALEPPAATPRELEDRVLARLGGGISRARAEQALGALRAAGAIRPGPDGLEWEQDPARLEEALRQIRQERIRRRLEEESPAFRERTMQRLRLSE